MKKIILTGCLAFSALFVTNVNAQTFANVDKPTDATPFSIETIVLGNYGTGINWTAPALRARYFFDNNIAARVQLGLGDGMGSAMSTTNRFYENGDGTGGEGTQEINRMAVNFQIGGEYHFVGTQKLDPYAALGINFGFGNQTITGTSYNDGQYAGSPIPGFGTAGIGYNEDYSYESTGGYSLFGATLGLGMDFYFVENVYLGVELGVGITGFSYKDAERTDKLVIGGATEEITASPQQSITNERYIGTQGTLRFGWRF